MITFISIANVFIQSGFNTALIQGKEVKDDDFHRYFGSLLVQHLCLHRLIFLPHR